MTVPTRRIDLGRQRISVTDGGGGMGRDIARTFAAWGARVAVCDLAIADAEATLKAIKESGGDGCAVAMDVTDEAGVRDGVAACWDAPGGLDILVNAICPGIIETAMMENLTRDAETSVEAYVGEQLIKRSQTPEDMAYAMAFLHISRAMTGQALNVDGGTVFH